MRRRDRRIAAAQLRAENARADRLARMQQIAAGLDAQADRDRAEREGRQGDQGQRETGITHSGPETLEIHGQAIGSGNVMIDGDPGQLGAVVSGGECGVPPRGPGREYVSGTRGAEPGRGHGPYIVNSGAGRVRVDRSVFGDGVTLVNGAEAGE